MQVGQFSLTTTDSGSVSIAGPREYMSAKGNAKIAEIEAGHSAVFRASLQHNSCIGTAILVTLQTDFAAWQGMQTFNTARGQIC